MVLVILLRFWLFSCDSVVGLVVLLLSLLCFGSGCPVVVLVVLL